MFYKFFFILLFNIISILQAQELQGFLTDEVLEKPIPFATILNLNTQQYILSDEKGFFQFQANLGDSLKIQHLSYEKKVIIVDKTEINILLSPKVTFLDEVNIENINSKYLGYYGQKSIVKYSLGMNFKYALRIPNELQSNAVVKTVKIPVKYIKAYINEGYFTIQFMEA